MYLRAVGRRFTQMNAYFLVMNSKRCTIYCITITVGPREIEDNSYAKFWEVNKMHYGLCENGESGQA